MSTAFIEFKVSGDDRFQRLRAVFVALQNAKATQECAGRQIKLKHPDGVLAKLIPNREAVALLTREHSDPFRNLLVVNADGTERFRIPNVQTINGRKVTGCFCWFEPSRKGLLSCFGVVLKSEPGGDMFELDIDSVTGHVVCAYSIR